MRAGGHNRAIRPPVPHWLRGPSDALLNTLLSDWGRTPGLSSRKRRAELLKTGPFCISARRRPAAPRTGRILSEVPKVTPGVGAHLIGYAARRNKESSMRSRACGGGVPVKAEELNPIKMPEIHARFRFPISRGSHHHGH